MAALRSSRCANGDSGSGSGRSLGLTPSMNAITAIAMTHASAMINGSYSLQLGQVSFDLVLVLFEDRVVDRGTLRAGSDLSQRLGLAVFLHEQPDDHQSKSDGGIRDDPPPRAGQREVNARSVVAN